MAKQCAVKSCDRVSRTRGLCQIHYGRWKRTGDPESEPTRNRAPKWPDVCTIEGCEKGTYSKGWCIKHYENNRLRGGPLNDGPGQGTRPYPNKWEGVKCSVDGCERDVHVSGFCSMHYERWRKHGDPGPAGLLVAARGNVDYIDANGYRIVSHPETRKATLEHRLVMEQTLGRSLRGNENVHHRNGDRLDNRPQNLELWVKSQPCGQRVVDLVAWANEIIDTYGAEAQREKRRRKTL